MNLPNEFHETRKDRTTLIISAYDAGHWNQRMGSGPEALLELLETRLRAGGSDVDFVRVGFPDGEWQSELRTGFRLQSQIGDATAEAVRTGSFPILLSGNCNASLGVVAGVQRGLQSLAFLWFDAHADFHTPATDEFGSLDCQGLSMLTGRAWQRLTTQAGLRPLPDTSVALIGARSIDDAEMRALRASSIHVLDPQAARNTGAREAVFRSLPTGSVDGVHIHIDADVLDPSIAPANDYAVAGGLVAANLHDIIEDANRCMTVTSMSIASYDPRRDQRGRLRNTLADVVLRTREHLV